jgi:primosomal protein N''
LEEKCEKLDAKLDENIARLKGLEKQVRNCESVNARLDKTLHQAENDNVKLVT